MLDLFVEKSRLTTRGEWESMIGGSEFVDHWHFSKRSATGCSNGAQSCTARGCRDIG